MKVTKKCKEPGNVKKLYKAINELLRKILLIFTSRGYPEGQVMDFIFILYLMVIDGTDIEQIADSLAIVKTKLSAKDIKDLIDYLNQAKSLYDKAKKTKRSFR